MTTLPQPEPLIDSESAESDDDNVTTPPTPATVGGTAPTIVGGPTVPSGPVPPRIGGIINQVAWTGGKPTSTMRSGSDLTEPRTPFCFRPTSASDSLKIYSRQTDVPSSTKLFARTDPLSAFENKFLDHLEKTGMDALPWVSVDGHKDMVNVIIQHSSTTDENVETYFDEMGTKGYIDVYEKKNGSSTKSWLLNAIEPALRATLYAKLDREAHCMVVWMTLVAEIRSESYRYFENVKSQIKALKLTDHPGENVKEFTQAFSLLADELETAGLLEPHFIVIFVTALTKTDVTMFLLAMSGLLTKALKYNKAVRFLTKEARRLMPVADTMSVRQVRGEADALYQELFEASEWTPAKTAGDRQVVPQVNLIKDLDETQLNALIQKAYQAGANGVAPEGDKDITDIKCCKKGHYANKCPDKKKELNWKKKAPGDGEAQIKTVQRDGEDVIYYWCAKCKRWTTSHNTLKHGNQGDDPTPAATAPPAAAANMAMHNSPLVHEDSDDSEEDDGAWTSV
jgi:hypothetical protein